MLAAIALLVAHMTACLSSSALLWLWLLLWGRNASPLDLRESLLDLRESLGSEAELSCLLACWLPWILSLELYCRWWWGWDWDNQVINWPLDFFLGWTFPAIRSGLLMAFSNCSGWNFQWLNLTLSGAAWCKIASPITLLYEENHSLERSLLQSLSSIKQASVMI